jgi:hypothetical protein
VRSVDVDPDFGPPQKDVLVPAEDANTSRREVLIDEKGV